MYSIEKELKILRQFISPKLMDGLKKWNCYSEDEILAAELRMSMIHAAKEYGIIICFQTLGLSKEFAEFIGDTRHHLPILLFEKALAAEKNFMNSFHIYRSIHSGNRKKERQKCQENLAVYKSYLRVLTILEITEEYEAYKNHC